MNLKPQKTKVMESGRYFQGAPAFNAGAYSGITPKFDYAGICNSRNEVMCLQSQLISNARRKLIDAINHLSQNDLSCIAALLTENNITYSVISRTRLLQKLFESCNNRLLLGAKILEREGSQEVMLFLLRAVYYDGRTLKSFARFKKWYANPKKFRI